VPFWSQELVVLLFSDRLFSFLFLKKLQIKDILPSFFFLIGFSFAVLRAAASFSLFFTATFHLVRY